MKSKALRFFFATIFLIMSGGAVGAAVINATNGSFAAVSAAVASANPGDTVFMPPGTNIWSGKLTISGITLAGSGINQTIIVDETPPVGNGTAFIQMNVKTNILTRVTQFQCVRGVTNTLPFQNYLGSIQIYGQAPLWRVDHCQFSYLTSKPVHVGDGSYGLIDHCTFLMSNTANCVEINDTGFGDASWASPSSFGSSNAVFVEDNYIYSANNFCAADVDNGGRCVFRNNTLVGCFFNTHGTETGQRYRSARQVEVYNNNFTWGGGLQYNNFYTLCDIRGGTGVVFSNTAVGFWSIASLSDYRAADNDQNFLPWFGATGLRAWDSNSPSLLDTTASVTTNVLIVAGATWVSNAWAGCTVYNYSNMLCGVVAGNNANTMTFITSRSAWLQIKFKAGDQITVHSIYPLLDQPGLGQCDLLSGDSPNPRWLNFQPDPVYVWNNSLSIMYQAPTVISPNAGSRSACIKEGRDFFNSAKPSYSPFKYPHPLTQITNAFSGSATNGVTPPPTNSVSTPTLAPPTGLNVHPF